MTRRRRQGHRLAGDPATRSRITAAHKEGIIDDATEELLEHVRRLRNGFVHAKEQPALTPGAVAPIIERTHEIVARIFA